MPVVTRTSRSRALGFAAALLTIAALSLPACSLKLLQPEPVYKGKSGLDPSRDASADLAEALAVASKTGKRVLIYAGGDWCIWCKVWSKFKKRHDGFADFLDRSYITVPVYYGPGKMNEEFFSQFPKFKTAPQFIFLEPDGEYLHHQDLSCCELRGPKYDRESVTAVFEKWAPPKHSLR